MWIANSGIIEGMKRQAPKLAKQENIYFFAALFAIMLAGDLIWWQAKQMSDEMGSMDAALYPATFHESRAIESMGQTIEDLDAESEEELNRIETSVE